MPRPGGAGRGGTGRDGAERGGTGRDGAGPLTSPAVHVEVRREAGVTLLMWPALRALGVDAALTTREGGVSTGPFGTLNLGMHVGDDPDAVVENRRRAARALGATLSDLVVGHQVHGTSAALVGPGDAGRGSAAPDDAIEGTDVLVTASVGPVLVTLAADCSPILLCDPAARVLATVHAGWRGALAPGGGAPGAALRAMASLGARPERTVALIGPTVAPASYEVGEEVAAAATACFGARADEVLDAAGGRPHLDVAGANRLQLVAGGVPARNVHPTPVTTRDARLYSARAEPTCGRFGLLARLRSA